MNMSSLTVEGFQDLLDRLGGNLDAWPDNERSAAQSLLAESPDAQHRLDDLMALEQALRTMPKAPAGLAERILAAAASSSKKS